MKEYEDVLMDWAFNLCEAGVGLTYWCNVVQKAIEVCDGFANLNEMQQ